MPNGGRQRPTRTCWIRSPTGDDTEGRTEALSVLDRLFGRERESTRTMAVLHYVDGMTLEQVANEVSMSVSGVRKRLRGLRESLQELERS